MRFAILVAGLLTGLIGYGQSPALQQLQTDVVYLASDYLQGRETGTTGEQRAADYIAWRFSQLGLQPRGKNGTFFHEFDFTFRPNPHAAAGVERSGRNVVALLDNGAPTTVIIGAHYDHLGMGEFSSLHTGAPDIHNGADDNASGVGAMLALAARLKDNPKTAGNNYLFMAFSGEELGLVGSKKWVADPTIDLGTVNYMLNMDMVGRLNDGKVLSINGVGTSPVWPEAVKAIRVGGIQPVTTESGIGASDHTAFYLQDLPVLHFFTGVHSDYHKPNDDTEYINFPGILAVTDYMLALIERLNEKGKLTFTKAAEEEQGREAARFKVSLGVMPDYVHSGKGMRIDSVIGGRAADKAGIKGGDVILSIGDKEVIDIYDYMEGLSKYSEGDTTTVRVERDGKEVTFEVTF